MVNERVDQDTRVLAYDQVWVKHIKAALAENRFHLVQQPIASLSGGAQKIFDVAVRMLDTQAREVLPSEFLPAAERNDLMRNIDRWVLRRRSKSFAKRSPTRCSCDCRATACSMHDARRLARGELKTTGADRSGCACRSPRPWPSGTCSRPSAAGELRKRQIKLALEHFGAGRDSHGLLNAGRRFPQDRRLADAGPDGQSGNCRSACAPSSRLRPGAHPDRGRAHRGCEHDGGGVAAWRAVHPGLPRARARRGRAQVVSGSRKCQTAGTGLVGSGSDSAIALVHAGLLAAAASETAATTAGNPNKIGQTLAAYAGAAARRRCGRHAQHRSLDLDRCAGSACAR
jgi:hypothetical protein